MTEFVFHPSLRAVAQSIAADTQASALPTSLIREAHLEDVAELTELLASSFYDRTGWLAWLYPVIKIGIQEDLKQRLKTDKTNYACLTAVATPPTEAAEPGIATAIAGTVEVSQRHAWPWQELSAKYAYISNLAVEQSFRRRGLAGRLLASCEALALTWQLENLYLHVMEDNLPARRLYRRAGFELFQAEESTAVWLGLQPRRLLLHKSIRPH